MGKFLVHQAALNREQVSAKDRFPQIKLKVNLESDFKSQ